MYAILQQRMPIFHAGAVWNETTAAVKSSASRSQVPSNISMLALAAMVMVILWNSGVSCSMNEEDEERWNRSDGSESWFRIPNIKACEDKV